MKNVQKVMKYIQTGPKFVEAIKNELEGHPGVYTPHNDSIMLSSEECDMQTKYFILMHELVHSTGHKSRLNRYQNREVKRDAPFWNDDYSVNSWVKEELIATLGAKKLCKMNGIKLRGIPNHLRNSVRGMPIHKILRLMSDKEVAEINSMVKEAVEYILR